MEQKPAQQQPTQPPVSPPSVKQQIDAEYRDLAKTMRETTADVAKHSSPKGILVDLFGMRTSTS